ncbi:calmodulin-binding receptor-like cytoplasmic kinase 2 [Selaginella moellendorffii]|nr:calmodulin-binding receptor-like cytoplasmic kinase 2 [Selaginella moellendorffii]|eukprot:XP_002985620.2 calmodulin-binding receptor-like cytoplasmic kinase 2 [Selaginella moellendorffii]
MTMILRKLSRSVTCLKPAVLEDGAPIKAQRHSDNRGFSDSSNSFSHGGFSRQAPDQSIAYRFDMAELLRITGNFSADRLVGQGGFGTVYKGRLRDGTVVAVKRAKKNNLESRITQEFRSEIQMLGNVEHLNLVKLLGYLEQDRERIIVAEFVPNGNLRQHLDGQNGSVLHLATRLDIAIDVAHALTYLHLYADRPIIHRDIKSTNILLTDTFRAKVSDFGFSRTGPADLESTHVSTQVKGTAGYVDPEYLHTYQLTDKSDVYSFGILVCEIITGRRPIELMRHGDERVTIRWTYKKFREGKLHEALDPRMEITPDTYVIIEQMMELALHCVAPKRTDRPSMKRVAEALWNIRRDHRPELQRLAEREISSSRAVSRSNSKQSDSRASAAAHPWL